MDTLPEPMAWLAAGVPLSLLIDLTAPAAPDSTAIFVEEAGDASWLLPATNAA